MTQDAWINASHEWIGGNIIGINGTVTEGMLLQKSGAHPSLTYSDDLVTDSTGLLSTDNGGIHTIHNNQVIFSTCSLAALTDGVNSRAELMAVFIDLLSKGLTREIVSYNIYLDDMTTVLKNVATTEYTFAGLASQHAHVVGVSALYDNAEESEIVEVVFTYAPSTRR